MTLKLLVDGAHGMFGNGAVRSLLDRGAEVVCFDIAPRPWYMDDLAQRVKTVSGDLMSPNELMRVCKEERVDGIVHLAGFATAKCQEHPWAGCTLNIMGTLMVLEVARTLGLRRVVCAGSVAAAGNVSGEFTEDVPREPISIYGMTKLAVEHLVENYARTYGVDGVVLRPTLGYGPGRYGWAPFTLIEPALRGQPVTVEDTGWTYELLYYKDCGDAFAAAALADTFPRRYYNLGNGGHRIPLGEVATIVQDAIPGSRIDVVYTGNHSAISTTQPATNVSAAQKDLGWQPQYPPDKGIPDFVDWIRNEYLPRFGR